MARLLAPVPRIVPLIIPLLSSLAWSGNALASAPASVISYAEMPVQLIRGTALYTVTAGIAVQSGDIIESGAAGAQIEGLASATIAIGPDTKIYLGRSGSLTEVDLLNGWLKVQPRSPSSPSMLTIVSGAFRIDAAGGASVIHATSGQVELFVEEGQQAVAELDKRGQPGHRQDLAREQYAVRRADQPLLLAGRPTKDFVAAMPKQFFDALVPVAHKLGSPPPLKKERDVAYEDISPWLLGFGDKKILVARFAPRLTDPVFHKKLSDELGRSAEWKPVLDGEDRKKAAVKNNLF